MTLVLLYGVGCSDYGFWCRYGFVAILLSTFSFVLISGHLLSPTLLIVLSSVAFQFGIPIIQVFDSGYANWYMQYLGATDLGSGAGYTVICLQGFILGLSIACRGLSRLQGATHESNASTPMGNRSFLEDKVSATRALAFFFVIFGLIAIPRATAFFGMSAAEGIEAARNAYGANGLVNISRGMFVPCGLCLLVYLDKGKKHSLVFLILMIYALLTMLSGDRTEGATLAVTLAYYFFSRKERRAIGLSRGIMYLLAAVAGLLILYFLVLVATTRVGGIASFMTPHEVIENAFGEMGFNFLTVCFQYQILDGPNYGLTYLASLASLIPSTLDFAGIKELSEQFMVTEMYYIPMGAKYAWATFGLGYSLVAESYANFGDIGWIAMMVIGFVEQRLLQTEGDSPFARYLPLVFLWSFLTLPRRQISWLVNAFKYDFIFVVLILWVGCSVCAVRNRQSNRRRIDLQTRG